MQCPSAGTLQSLPWAAKFCHISLVSPGIDHALITFKTISYQTHFDRTIAHK
jgi:hypothetical protein